jgi:hypothetical protein
MRYASPAQARRNGGTRHQIAAAAADRRHTRRRDRRAGERTWRTEWDFALRPIAA